MRVEMAINRQHFSNATAMQSQRCSAALHHGLQNITFLPSYFHPVPMSTCPSNPPPEFHAQLRLGCHFSARLEPPVSICMLLPAMPRSPPDRGYIVYTYVSTMLLKTGFRSRRGSLEMPGADFPLGRRSGGKLVSFHCTPTMALKSQEMLLCNSFCTYPFLYSHVDYYIYTVYMP